LYVSFYFIIILYNLNFRNGIKTVPENYQEMIKTIIEAKPVSIDNYLLNLQNCKNRKLINNFSKKKENEN